MADSESEWRVANIPTAILIALILQIGGTIWWAARMDTRLDISERVDNALLVRIERLEATNQKLTTELAATIAEFKIYERRYEPKF